MTAPPPQSQAHKSFQLPVSDCGCFVAGKISAATFEGDNNWPEHGVLVFYRTEEAAKEAIQAAVSAHWGDK